MTTGVISATSLCVWLATCHVFQDKQANAELAKIMGEFGESGDPAPTASSKGDDLLAMMDGLWWSRWQSSKQRLSRLDTVMVSCLEHGDGLEQLCCLTVVLDQCVSRYEMQTPLCVFRDREFDVRTTQVLAHQDVMGSSKICCNSLYCSGWWQIVRFSMLFVCECECVCVATSRISLEHFLTLLFHSPKAMALLFLSYRWHTVLLAVHSILRLHFFILPPGGILHLQSCHNGHMGWCTDGLCVNQILVPTDSVYNCSHARFSELKSSFQLFISVEKTKLCMRMPVVWEGWSTLNKYLLQEPMQL